MKSLSPGLRHQLQFVVPVSKTVPALYPESEYFRQMPEVFATGFMVGLLEWACVDAIAPYLDWPRQQTVGTHIDVSHVAATPPGLTVTVRTLLAAVDGRRLSFEVDADDGVDVITTGRHERVVIDRDPFVARVGDKVDQARREQAGRPFDEA